MLPGSGRASDGTHSFGRFHDESNWTEEETGGNESTEMSSLRENDTMTCGRRSIPNSASGLGGVGGGGAEVKKGGDTTGEKTSIDFFSNRDDMGAEGLDHFGSEDNGKESNIKISAWQAGWNVTNAIQVICLTKDLNE